MSSAENRILLKGDNHFEEAEADATITPGMDVGIAADGDCDPNPLAVGEAVKRRTLIALEDALQGNSVTDNYSAGDLVFLYAPVAGDICNILVKDGETIAVNDNLVSEGGGTGLWVEAAGTEARYQWKALEAASPSGSNALVKCEYLG